MTTTLDKLAKVIEQRKLADPQHSYVASLYDKGLDAILRKVGEEAIETILAAKCEDDTRLVSGDAGSAGSGPGGCDGRVEPALRAFRP